MMMMTYLSDGRQYTFKFLLSRNDVNHWTYGRVLHILEFGRFYATFVSGDFHPQLFDYIYTGLYTAVNCDSYTLAYTHHQMCSSYLKCTKIQLRNSASTKHL